MTLEELVRVLDALERLKTALRSLWDDPCIEEIDAAELAGEYPALRLEGDE